MSQLTRKAFLQALVGMPCVLLSGCASWFFTKVEETKPSQLPQVPIPEDVIVAEVSLIRVREPELELAADAWSLADEQVIPIAKRRDLDANGLRCGRFGGDLPAPLRKLLEVHEAQMMLAKSEGEDVKGDPTLNGLRMQLRAARKGEIRIRGAQPQISVLLSKNGVITGGAFPDASCSFLIRGYPTAAASAEIELTPYVEHGLPKRNWSSESGELEMNIARPRQEFDNLQMVVQLGPGEVMLVGPNAPPKGLGGVFFHEHADAPSHCLLLIRLALAQADGVFRTKPQPDA